MEVKNQGWFQMIKERDVMEEEEWWQFVTVSRAWVAVLKDARVELVCTCK